MKTTVAIFIIASILLFSNLGNQYMWQDEAETASLAKNILRFGLPKVYDGRNIILLDMFDYPENYLAGQLWRGQPWLAIYIASFSFSIFGLTTLAARLPFAFMGILSLLLTYLLARRLFRERSVANLAVLLLALSVPFLLHSRQCRYYSPGILLTLLSIHLYLNYIDKRRFSTLVLFAGLLLLLNTSVSYFMTATGGILLHLISVERGRAFTKRNVAFFLALAIFSIPNLVIFRLSRRFYPLNLHWMLHNVRYYIRDVNKFLFSYRFFGAAYLFYIIRRRTFRVGFLAEEKGPIWLLLSFIIMTFPGLIFVNFNSLRYVIHIAPLSLMLEARIFAEWMKRSKILGAAAVSLALCTNILSFSVPVRSYLADYIYEITHDYDGPIEGIVRFLKANAKDTDTVKITYGDNACIFYTRLKVDNRQPFEDYTYPAWIVPRIDWNKGFYGSDYEKEVKNRYEEITLAYPDIQWENRPDDMGYHKFRTDTVAPRLKIYRRIAK